MTPTPPHRRPAKLWMLSLAAVAAFVTAGALFAGTPAPVAPLAAEEQQIDGFTVREGFDQVGHTFADQPAPDATACLQLCRDNERCVAFTFEVKRALCHLKDTPNLMRPAPGKVTGARSK